MKLHNIAPIIALVLATTLIVQLAIRYNDKPEPTYFASWNERPKDMNEAKKLAKKIVTGVVTKVERGQDLVVKVAGEPNDEDRIPVEVVTIRVEKVHKGAQDKVVHVFRTGGTKDPKLTNRPAPPMSEAPPKPKGGVDRPAKMPRPTPSQARTVMLEDDPPYTVGERKILLLTDGPTVTVAGASVQTQRPIAPEGRYRVKADNNIQPVVERRFTTQMRDKPVADFEKLLR